MKFKKTVYFLLKINNINQARAAGFFKSVYDNGFLGLSMNEKIFYYNFTAFETFRTPAAYMVLERKNLFL